MTENAAPQAIRTTTSAQTAPVDRHGSSRAGIETGQVAERPKLHCSSPMDLVLIVDDSETERSLLAELVREEGFQVLEAASLAEARRCLATAGDDIKLLLCDHLLPDGRGATFLGELEASEPVLRSILLTSSVDAPELSDCNFMAKPLDVPALLGLLDEVRHDS